MRRHLANRLGVVEIVTKLIAVFLFAFGHFAFEQTVLPKPFAHTPHERRRLRPGLRQDVARTVKASLRVRKRRRRAVGQRARVHILRRLNQRRQRRVGMQRIGQRLQARLTRDLRLRAALHFVREVQIFNLLLGKRSVESKR